MRIVNFKSEKTVALSSIRDLFGISDGWELCARPATEWCRLRPGYMQSKWKVSRTSIIA